MAKHEPTGDVVLDNIEECFERGWTDGLPVVPPTQAGLARMLRNVGGALPGELDRATLGHPGKYTYCIGEDEENSPWLPLHVERGFEKDASVVTVLACDGPHQFGSPRGGTDTILGILIDSLRS